VASEYYQLAYVRDGASGTDCTTGGGSSPVLCSWNGSAWTAYGGGGGGGGDTITSPGGTLAVGGTPTNTTLDLALGHANTWTGKQTQPAPLLPNLAGGGTQCLDVDNTGQVAGTGAACGAGGGGVGPGTVGFLPAFATTTTVGNSHVDDGATTAGVVTSTEPIAVSSTADPSQIVLTPDTHTPTTLAGSAIYAVDASGNAEVSENGAAQARICTAANGICGAGGGGYTNVTGSVAETTVAQINTVGGSGTYYATTPLSIATGGTITVPVQFSKAGLWTIASGQTVTFTQNPKETDGGPNQHFAGSGTVVLPGPTAPIEWFGAISYSSKAAAIAGTDSLAAIQACVNALNAGQCT